MRYWIAAQSPPLEGSPDQKLDRLSLAAGREAAGRELEVGDRRVFVVAYSVSPEMRELCASYGVETFVVERNLVRSWNGHRSSAGL